MEWYYQIAKKCYQKGLNAENSLSKLGYLSYAIEGLLLSDDHLLNWYLYPNWFHSRGARHSSFIDDRKIKRKLEVKIKVRVTRYPFVVLNLRNRLAYLSNQRSIYQIVDNFTIIEIQNIFKEADYVRGIIKKL